MAAPGPPRVVGDRPGDRVRDAVCVVAAAVAGLALLLLDGAVDGPPGAGSRTLDLVLGMVAAGSLWWRRRYPIGVAVAALPAAVLAASSVPALAVALFAVSARRSLPVAGAVAALQVLAALAGTLVSGVGTSLQSVVSTALLAIGLVAWGQLSRARRDLIASLHERAERAESEQRLREDGARQAERTRIAREMHDVVAHRISLLALHAGALELADDAASARESAGTIRVVARQALEELREVIGVLHDGSPSPTPTTPQPGIDTIDRLVAESRAAGARITLHADIEQQDRLPAALGRDAYRIVQEGLTNVAKHARGAATDVEVTGAPGQGLRVVVRNRIPLESMSTDLPGARRGLVGLVERAELSGGTLRHGPDGAGNFVVDADLAWT